MLKRRIIPVELFDGNRLIKTVGFDNARDVGHPIKSSQVYSDQDADELIFLNVSRNERSISQMRDVVSKIAGNCFVPLAVGGGIFSADDAARLFDAGADKVILNSVTYRCPEVVTKIAEIHGKQAVVVCIDAKRIGLHEFGVYSDCGRRLEAVSLIDHTRAMTVAGAGEIMIQSIDRDGHMAGYDLDLLRTVIENTSTPVIAAGGAGDFLHLRQAFEVGADAAACGSLFNFGDNNPLRAKAYLKNYDIPLKKI
jgi:cyclase